MSDSVRARLQAELEASGYIPGSVQSEWERKVADEVDPLVEALKRGVAESESDHD